MITDIELAPGRRAVAARLGVRLRAADPSLPENDVLKTLAAGRPVDRQLLERVLGDELVGNLVVTRIVRASAGSVWLDHPLGLAHDVIFAAPDADPDDAQPSDLLYLNSDSAFLSEAALQLAPFGERAVDLGAGTGLHAALMARRYATVIATELLPRTAAAARLTLDLNGCDRTGVVVTDVASALRPRSFDLVTANPPWVPTPVELGAAPRVYADGGPTGTELPCRFLREAAALLRPGGVAIVFALDMLLDDGTSPIRDACDELALAGYITALAPTFLCRMYPDLATDMRARQPRLRGTDHAAVVVAARSHSSRFEHMIRSGVEQLAARWATAPLPSDQRLRDEDVSVTATGVSAEAEST